MFTSLKPGDRVRLKDTMCFGTVAEVAEAAAGGGGADALVEWDECPSAPSTVELEKLEYVRPPPSGWPEPAAGLPCDR